MPSSSKILFIDTATEFVWLSLVVEGKEVGFAYENDNHNHAVTIMPLLEKLLKNNGIGLPDMGEVVVGIGPGSYTGVRIGVSIAKMIGYVNHIPVRTVSTLALIASGSAESRIFVSIDARRGNSFMAYYGQDRNRLWEIIPDTLDNTAAFRAQISEPCTELHLAQPDPVKILKSGFPQPVPNVHELVPNYLQVTEAERNKGRL